MSALQERTLTFTHDWVSAHIPAWQRLIPMMESREKFLEIGSFEGRSACWFLQNALSPKGTLYCIDTWQGSAEFIHLDPSTVSHAEETFHRNIEIAQRPQQKVKVLKDQSSRALAKLITEGHENSFDLIYVDGSHEAPDVLTDACMAWTLLKPEGLMIFDDYIFNLQSPIDKRPKVAIDMFTALFNSQLFTVVIGDQYVVSKIPH